MTQQLSPYRFALKYGLIIAAIPIAYNTFLVVFDLLLTYHGEGMGPLKMYVNLFVLPVFIFVAIFNYKKTQDGFLKFHEALIIGLEIALIAIILMLIYDTFFNTVLAPTFHLDYYEKYGQEIYEHFQQTADNPEKEFERHKNIRIQFWTLYTAHIIINVVVGLVFSIIAGLIMKKKVNV